MAADPEASVLHRSDEEILENTDRKKLTYQQLKTLTVILAATLTSSFAVCLFPPFFPRLAEEKGCNAATYGFIIGTNCITSFLVTPFIGKNLPRFGVCYSMVSGLLIGGICCGMSGFLEFFPPSFEFIVTSIIIRAVHATGNAFVITATFTYAAGAFDSSVGTVFSLTRIAMNFAQLLGPMVGGAIYQAGGFYLPFLTMGSLQVFMGIVCACCLPQESLTSTGAKTCRKLSILKILKIPTIWFSFTGFIVATMCNGFLSINLEPQVLRGFDLEPLVVGMLFGMKDGANCLSTPLWGYLCDKKNRESSVKHYLVISALLVGLSFLLMGAGCVVMLNVTMTLPLVIVALCVNGVGIGGEQVSGVVDALNEAVNAGYPDDPAMHGLIAGLWSSFSGLGRFVSRVGSGLLVDFIGFNYTAAIVTALQLIVALLTFIYLVFCECHLKVRRDAIWDSENSAYAALKEDAALFENSTESTTDTLSTPGSSRTGNESVSIDVPISQTISRSRLRNRVCNSLPQSAQAANSWSSNNLAHSFFNEMG